MNSTGVHYYSYAISQLGFSYIMCMSKDEVPIRTGIPPTSQLMGSDKFTWKSSFHHNDV